MDKRTFLRQMAMMGLGASIPFLEQVGHIVREVAHLSPGALASDEEFWAKIRSGYRLKPEDINLENGYYCFMPQEILEFFIRQVRHINYEASRYLRTVQFENKKKIAAQLAALADCPEDQLIVTRNTTESLDTIISGFPWKPGDEAVMAHQDYGAMLDMFKQVGRRYGIVNRIISIPNHPASDEEIVRLYENAITPRTKLLMICHMINITGQILPVKKVVDMAHEKGVEVMVDGAHAFAQIDFSIRELGCDYYGASLHKWLSAPLGAGILYVKKERIPQIWPLFGEEGMDQDNILRLNHTGTHPVHTDLAIAHAIAYHERIGIERKEARLRFLQHYWTDKVRDWPHIILNTPAAPHRSCAIANVGVRGIHPRALANLLHEKYKIWTVGIVKAGVKGCRITPNVYTTTEELDVLVNALEELG